MKKIISLFSILVIVLCVCGCTSIDSMNEKLTNKGYTVTVYDEQVIANLNKDMITYDSLGSVVAGFYAVDEENNVVYVIEFEYREDRDTIYREIEKSLSGTETIDVCGNMIVYGSEKGVEDAL